MKKSRSYKKICAFCREEFESHNRKQMYCCHSCRTQAYTKRIEQGVHISEIRQKVKEYMANNQIGKIEAEEPEINLRDEVLRGIGNAIANYIIKK